MWQCSVGLGSSARTKAPRSGWEMRTKAKIHSRRALAALKPWWSFAHTHSSRWTNSVWPALKESTTTIRWIRDVARTTRPQGCLVCTKLLLAGRRSVDRYMFRCSDTPPCRNIIHTRACSIPTVFPALMQPQQCSVYSVQHEVGKGRKKKQKTPPPSLLIWQNSHIIRVF